MKNLCLVRFWGLNLADGLNKVLTSPHLIQTHWNCPWNETITFWLNLITEAMILMLDIKFGNKLKHSTTWLLAKRKAFLRILYSIPPNVLTYKSSGRLCATPHALLINIFLRSYKHWKVKTHNNASIRESHLH